MNDSYKSADEILQQPFAHLRMELAGKFFAKKLQADDFTSLSKKMLKAAENYPAISLPDLSAEIKKAYQFLKDGKSDEAPNIENPAHQYVWGLALACSESDPKVRGGWAEPMRSQPIYKLGVWQKIKTSPMAVSELRRHAFMITKMSFIKEDVDMKWGACNYPSVGYYYDKEKNVINLDLLWALVGGFEHTRAAQLHEIGHSQGTLLFTRKMQEMKKQYDALNKKVKERTIQKEEYKTLKKIGREYNYLFSFFDEAENSFANRFAVNASSYGMVRQDIGYDLNSIETQLFNVGADIEKNRTEKTQVEDTPANRAYNLKRALRLSFFVNNGIIQDNPEGWRDLGVNIDWIEYTDKSGKTISGAEAFQKLREMTSELERLQLRQREYHKSEKEIRRLALEYSQKRCDIIDEIYDGFAKKFYDRAHENEQEEQKNKQLGEDQEGKQDQEQEGKSQQEGNGNGEGQSDKKNEEETENDKGKGNGEGQDNKDKEQESKDDKGNGQGQQEQDNPEQKEDSQQGNGNGQGQEQQEQEQQNQQNSQGQSGQSEQEQEQQNQQNSQGQSGQSEQNQQKQQKQQNSQDWDNTENESDNRNENDGAEEGDFGNAFEDIEWDEMKPLPQLSENPEEEYQKRIAELSDGIDDDEAQDILDIIRSGQQDNAQSSSQNSMQQQMQKDAANAKSKMPDQGQRTGSVPYTMPNTLMPENEFSKIISKHSELVEELERRFIDLRNKYEDFVPDQEVHSITPEAGNLKVDIPSYIERLKKQITGEELKEKDFENYIVSDESRAEAKAPIDIAILIDNSGSMQSAGTDTLAIEIGCCLFQATRDNPAFNVYVTLMHEPTTWIAKPGENSIDISQRLATVRNSHWTGDDKIGHSIVSIIDDSSKELGNTPREGMLNFFMISDGDHTDGSDAFPIVEDIIQHNMPVTFNWILTQDKRHSWARDIIDRHPEGVGSQRVDYVDGVGNGNILEKLMTLIEKRVDDAMQIEAHKTTEKKMSLNDFMDRLGVRGDYDD